MTKEQFHELQISRAATRYTNYIFDVEYMDQWKGKDCFFARYTKPDRVLFLYATVDDTELGVVIYKDDEEVLN